MRYRNQFSLPSRGVLAICVVLACSALACKVACAQANVGPPVPTGAKNVGLLPPSIIDKFLAMEIEFDKAGIKIRGADGAKVYRRSYDNCSVDVNLAKLQTGSDVGAALALGMKIADGIVALKARHAEGMKQCADAIDPLARKLGAGDEDLRRAREVKRLADKGLWRDAFMELGFLQEDIVIEVERNQGKREKAILIFMGAWVQGGRHVTELMLEHHQPMIGNILREPMFIQQALEEMKVLPAETRNDPKFKAVEADMTRFLKIIDIKMDADVPKPQIEEYHQMCLKLSQMLSE